jgi:hypothetical protein
MALGAWWPAASSWQLKLACASCKLVAMLLMRQWQLQQHWE